MSFLIGENVCAQNIWDGRWGCIYRCRTEWETGRAGLHLFPFSGKILKEQFRDGRPLKQKH